MADIKLETNNIAGARLGSQTVSKLMIGTTQIWPQVGAGYYDCGYGCQYYTYNPGCPVCGTISVVLSNFSTDLSFTSATIDNKNIFGVNYPVASPSNQYGTTNESGVLTVMVYVTGTLLTQNISLLDSNYTTQCQNFTGNGYYTFYGVTVNNNGITITADDGSCY